MDNTRMRRYLLSMHGQDTVGIMYNTSNDRLINVTKKELAAAALEAAEEALGMKDAAWISCDTLKKPEGGDVMTSNEKTMPEEYYQDGYDFLIVVSDKNNDAEKAKEKVQEIQNFLQTWNLNISEVITYKSAFYLIFKTEGMRKDNTLHLTAVRKLIQILRYTYTDDSTTVKGTDRRCCMYPLPGTTGVDMIPEFFSDTRNTYDYINEFVAARYPEMQKAQEWNKFKPENFSIEVFLKRNRIRIIKDDVIDNARRYVIPCPFCHGASSGDMVENPATIIHHETGEISYVCMTCLKPHTWDDIRKIYEPTNEEKLAQEHNDIRYKKRAKPVYVDESKLSEDYHKYGHYNSDDQLYVKSLQPEPEYIRTGITELDQTVGGLGRGKLSVLVGASGSGKSTLLTQISLDAAEDGERVGMTAAEQKLEDIVTWRDLIAAGGYNVRTGIAHFYSTPWMIVKKISTWLRGKNYINSNTWMNGTEKTSAYLKRLEETIVAKDLTLYIIDNLMSLDISEYSEYGSEYTAQQKFMWAVKRVAERTGCHIILCVHPNKAAPIVTIDNIMGSSYIRAVADEVYIMHKVDSKFRNNVGMMLHWKTGTEIKVKGKNGKENEYYPPDPRLEASNLVEIAKSRATGITDHFIKMFYESKSKRLKNSPGEVKHYGWEQLDPTS